MSWFRRTPLAVPSAPVLSPTKQLQQWVDQNLIKTFRMTPPLGDPAQASWRYESLPPCFRPKQYFPGYDGLEDRQVLFDRIRAWLPAARLYDNWLAYDEERDSGVICAGEYAIAICNVLPWGGGMYKGQIRLFGRIGLIPSGAQTAELTSTS